MSPYRTPAERPQFKCGYVGRFTTNIYGDLVIRYVESRWLWVLRIKAWLFILGGNGFEQVQFRQLDGTDYRAEDRALAEKYHRIVLLEDFQRWPQHHQPTGPEYTEPTGRPPVT